MLANGAGAHANNSSRMRIANRNDLYEFPVYRLCPKIMWVPSKANRYRTGHRRLSQQVKEFHLVVSCRQLERIAHCARIPRLRVWSLQLAILGVDQDPRVIANWGRAIHASSHT